MPEGAVQGKTVGGQGGGAAEPLGQGTRSVPGGGPGPVRLGEAERPWAGAGVGSWVGPAPWTGSVSAGPASAEADPLRLTGPGGRQPGSGASGPGSPWAGAQLVGAPGSVCVPGPVRVPGSGCLPGSGCTPGSVRVPGSVRLPASPDRSGGG